jgi:hypothetical protein
MTSSPLDVTPLSDAQPRVRQVFLGQVVGIVTLPAGHLPRLTFILGDATGRIQVSFSGRAAIAGITLGRRLIIDGVPALRGDRLHVENPSYQLQP